jgi:hypothetical protein
MKTAVQDTSIAAFHQLPGLGLKTQQDRIFDIVADYCKRPGKDLSLNEIKRLHRAIHGDIELSTISARVNALVSAGRLERREDIRKYAITGAGIHAVRLPVRQLELI